MYQCTSVCVLRATRACAWCLCLTCACVHTPACRCMHADVDDAVSRARSAAPGRTALLPAAARGALRRRVVACAWCVAVPYPYIRPRPSPRRSAVPGTYHFHLICAIVRTIRSRTCAHLLLLLALPCFGICLWHALHLRQAAHITRTHAHTQLLIRIAQCSIPRACGATTRISEVGALAARSLRIIHGLGDRRRAITIRRRYRRCDSSRDRRANGLRHCYGRRRGEVSLRCGVCRCVGRGHHR